MLFRLRDILLSVLGLLLLSPLLLFVALLLWVGQRQVFFFQQRPGKDEKPFVMVKFAKMDPEGRELTPLGRWIQRWSIDELPQLFNVLKGDMSLVGPRPLLMEYLPLYTSEERRRHSVKPGITGWAQVNGRNNLPFKQRFQLDLWYVQHRSFWLDSKILLLSIAKVFSGEGSAFNPGRFEGEN